MATNLLPFRDYDEHDVVNLFGYRGEIDAGHIMILDASADGFKNTAELSLLDEPGAAFGNTVSERYGVAATMLAASGASKPVLGMLLYDVKETDENGEKLVFNPRKAAEMEIALSGQAAPVCSRGIFLYSGTQLASETPTAGISLYYDDNAELTTGTTNSVVVGKALGVKDDNNHVLVRIDV